MRKVFQTKFGGSDSPREHQGNCFQACLATMFELPLEEAFDMMAWEEGEWWDKFLLWLKPYGLGCVCVGDGWVGDAGLYIQDRKSTTLRNPDDRHVVVAWMEDGFSTVLHDPNPVTKELGEVVGAFLFTPLSKEKFLPRRDFGNPFFGVLLGVYGQDTYGLPRTKSS